MDKTKPPSFGFHIKSVAIRASDIEVPFIVRQLAALQFSCEVDKMKTCAKAAIAWRGYYIWRVYVALSSSKPPETTPFETDVVKQACLLIAGKMESWDFVDDNPLFWTPFLFGSSKVVEQEASILEMLDYTLPVHTPHDNCTDDEFVDAAIFSVIDLDVGLRHSSDDVYRAARLATGLREHSAANVLSILAALPRVKQEDLLTQARARKKRRTIVTNTNVLGPLMSRPPSAVSCAIASTSAATGSGSATPGDTTHAAPRQGAKTR
ncbi:hypothetical protein N9S30_00400 [bacterium]|nr:hypothetical protein [bacterium]